MTCVHAEHAGVACWAFACPCGHHEHHANPFLSDEAASRHQHQHRERDAPARGELVARAPVVSMTHAAPGPDCRHCLKAPKPARGFE
jgi:hypothetical protein